MFYGGATKSLYRIHIANLDLYFYMAYIFPQFGGNPIEISTSTVVTNIHTNTHTHCIHTVLGIQVGLVKSKMGYVSPIEAVILSSNMFKIN